MKTRTKGTTHRPFETAVPGWLVDSIARESWALNGRGGSLDWAGVEIHLGRIVKRARSDAKDSQSIRVAAVAAGRRAGRAQAAMEGARS